MKQVIQIYRTGELKVADVPSPLVRDNSLLVKTINSVISAGTEKSGLALAQKSLIGKARSRPDLVKKVVDKVKTEGLAEAYRQSLARLDTPVPLGYSSCGKILEAGKRVQGFRPGDRVAGFGAGVASHAEIVNFPPNLAVIVPDPVSSEDAAFAGVGAIALHGTRLLESSLGEGVAVIGLGLLGLISAQMLIASGCRVFGYDPDPDRVELARKLGIEFSSAIEEEFISSVFEGSAGRGTDGAVIWAAASGPGPLHLAGSVCRQQGSVSIPGLVGLDIPREIFYQKELRVVIPRSAGPGIYDPNYEFKGIDYPSGYVRWTAQRNMAEFLRLVADKKVLISELLTHRFSINQATEAYDLISGKKQKSYLGVVLTYPETCPPVHRINLASKSKAGIKKQDLGVGLIGAGLFAKGTLLPAIQGTKGITLTGVATAGGASGTYTGKKFGFRFCTTDYREILEDPKTDCVLIATRHDLHAPMILEALKAGKAVFVEKPLCINKEELDQIEQALSASSLPLMVGYNRRFSPHSIRLKQFLESRQGPWIISCRCNAGFVPAESWVQDPQEGAGRVIGEAGHFIDLIQYLGGGLTRQVGAQAAGMSGTGFVPEDNLVITLALDNGSVGTIVYAACGARSYPRERVELFGSGCVGEIENFKSSRFVSETKTQKYSRSTVDRGHRNEFAAFFQAVREGKSPVAFADYRATSLATFRIEASLRSGDEQIL